MCQKVKYGAERDKAEGFKARLRLRLSFRKGKSEESRHGRLQAKCREDHVKGGLF